MPVSVCRSQGPRPRLSGPTHCGRQNGAIRTQDRGIVRRSREFTPGPRCAMSPRSGARRRRFPQDVAPRRHPPRHHQRLRRRSLRSSRHRRIKLPLLSADIAAEAMWEMQPGGDRVNDIRAAAWRPAPISSDHACFEEKGRPNRQGPRISTNHWGAYGGDGGIRTLDTAFDRITV